MINGGGGGVLSFVRYTTVCSPRVFWFSAIGPKCVDWPFWSEAGYIFHSWLGITLQGTASFSSSTLQICRQPFSSVYASGSDTLRLDTIRYGIAAVMSVLELWYGVSIFRPALKYCMENHWFWFEIAYRFQCSGRSPPPELSSLFPSPLPPPLLPFFPGSIRTNNFPQTNIRSHFAHTKSCN